MLVGKGLIARAFADLAADPDIKIFASGVSNSLEERRAEFIRERDLLHAEIKGFRGLLVYFGTASIHDPSETARPYVRHKLAMENLVEEDCQRFVIFRLPQVVGRNAKSNTIIEFFRHQILTGEPFNVWAKARRRLIDVDDVSTICRAQIARLETCNRAIDLVPPVSIGAQEIVAELEAILGRPAHYSLIDRGGDLELDVAPFVAMTEKLGLTFGLDYPRAVIRKYYKPT